VAVDLANEDESYINPAIGLTMMVALAALEDTLLALAAFHENRPGPWLDQLQNRFETNVKNSIGEGLSIEAEASMMDGALAILRMAMNRVRDQLSGQPPGNNDIA
jgi:hypothetical protein